MADPLIHTRNLAKVYQVGDHVIRALGCLERPTSGEYALGGKRVSELEGDELAVGARTRDILGQFLVEALRFE